MKTIGSFTQQNQMNTTSTNENETEGRAGCLLAQKATCRISSIFGFKKSLSWPDYARAKECACLLVDICAYRHVKNVEDTPDVLAIEA